MIQTALPLSMSIKSFVAYIGLQQKMSVRGCEIYRFNLYLCSAKRRNHEENNNISEADGGKFLRRERQGRGERMVVERINK